MKFFKQPNEVIDHILSLLKDSSWFKEAKLQLPDARWEDEFSHEGIHCTLISPSSFNFFRNIILQFISLVLPSILHPSNESTAP